MEAHFHPHKDASQTNSLYVSEFKNFYNTYRGEYIPNVEMEIYPEEGDREISGDTRLLVVQQLEIIKNTQPAQENTMYVPMSVVLTSISLDVDKSSDDVLVFVPNSSKALKVMDGSENKPDLVAFFCSRGTANNIAKRAMTDITIPVAHLLITAVEMKVSQRATLQCLRYMFVLSRHRPASSLQYGFVANSKGFQFFSLGLDKQKEWEVVIWDNPDPISKLYTCVKRVLQEAKKKRNPAVPRLLPSDTYEKDDSVLAIYRAMVDKRDYHLLPIFYGRGNGRKPFVAIAVPTGGERDNPDTVRVFKYSWYTVVQRKREYNLLRKLVGVPGIVQIDEVLSRESIGKDESSGCVRSLLALKTVGRPLCSCSSVLEFLEAMYDLLEVLRYLVQEKNILHRDISWYNVLIRPEHASDVEISIRSEPTDEVIRHDYRYISDIFDEKGRSRVRVVLADFDVASDLSSSSEEELKEATGTPMFMANDLLLPSEDDSGFGPTSYEVLCQAAKQDCAVKYTHFEEEAAWDIFYSNLSRINFIHKNPRGFFKYGAVHDAESVFYLCLLFFNRMRRSSMVDEVVSEDQERDWGEGFEALASKRLRKPTTRHSSLEGSFSISFDNSFVEMIKTISLYLKIPWYNEIRKLRSPNGDPISIEPAPRRVRMKLQQSGDAFTTTSKGLLSGKRTRDDDQKAKPKEASEPARGVVTRGQEVPRTFHPKHFEILSSKKRERLWLVADKWA